MLNDELNEKKRLDDFCKNTVIRVEMTVEQASDIYASLMFCGIMFRERGFPDRARKLERLAKGFLGKAVEEYKKRVT